MHFWEYLTQVSKDILACKYFIIGCLDFEAWRKSSIGLSCNQRVATDTGKLSTIRWLIINVCNIISSFNYRIFELHPFLLNHVIISYIIIGSMWSGYNVFISLSLTHIFRREAATMMRSTGNSGAWLWSSSMNTWTRVLGYVLPFVIVRWKLKSKTGTLICRQLNGEELQGLGMNELARLERVVESALGRVGKTKVLFRAN